MARPKKPIDVELLIRLASIHCTYEEMADIFKVSVDTLERRYADVIKEAKSTGKSSLRRHQWALAQNGNATMLIWLGKQLLGQRDYRTEQLQISGSLGTSPITSEERDQRIAQLLAERAVADGE